MLCLIFTYFSQSKYNYKSDILISIMKKKNIYVKTNEKVFKKLDWKDIPLIKATVLFFTFALITTVPEVLQWVLSIDKCIWWTLAIIVMIRPFSKMLRAL